MLLGFVLLAASFFAASHFLPWTAFHHESLAALGALCIGTATFRSGKPMQWPLLAICVLGVALIPLAQWLGGLTLFRGDAILSSLYLVSLALAIASGATLAATRMDDLLDGLATTLLFVGLASTIIAAAQWVGVVLPLPDLVYNVHVRGDRAVASLGQPNQLALCLVWGLIAGGWLYHRRKIRGVFLAAAALMIGFGLAATQSRAGWMMVAVLVAWSLYARRRAPILLPALAVPFFAIYVLVLSLSWGALAAWVSVDAGRNFTDGGINLRPLHWRYMVEALGRSPWLGYGWGELIVGVGDVASSMPPVREMTEYAHNLYLDLLMWNGIPLGLLVAGGLTWWALRHVSRLRDASAAFLLAGVLSIAAYSMVEFPHAYIYFLIPAGLMVGALDALSRDASRGISMPRPIHAGLLLFAAATALVAAVEYVKIDTDIREMRLSYMGLEKRKAPQEAPFGHHPGSSARIPRLGTNLGGREVIARGV